MFKPCHLSKKFSSGHLKEEEPELAIKGLNKSFFSLFFLEISPEVSLRWAHETLDR